MILLARAAVYKYSVGSGAMRAVVVEQEKLSTLVLGKEMLGLGSRSMWSDSGYIGSLEKS